MNAIEIGKRLIELTTSDNDAQALEELYADDVVSIEANVGEDAKSDVFNGLAAVREKHEWWNGVATMHETTAEGPFAGEGEDQFAVRFWMDVTMEEQGRVQMAEIGLYTVSDGKIVREIYLPLAT